MASRGRPRKEVSIAKMKAIAFAPEGTDPNAYTCLDAGYDLTTETGIFSKMEVIDRALTEALNKANALKKTTSAKAAESTPWMTADSPYVMAQRLRQQIWIGQRIMENLEGLLVDNSLVVTSLCRRLAVAESEIARQLGTLPKGISDFAMRLNDSGLIASPLGKLTNGDIEMIVGAINRRSLVPSDDGGEPVARPIRRNDPAEIEALVSQTVEARRVSEANRPKIEEMTVPDDLVPVASQYGDRWLDPVVPAPADFWDGIVDVGLPYRWEYSSATPEDIGGVMTFVMPERDSWDSFREHVPVFKKATDRFDARVEWLEVIARNYIGLMMNLKPAEVHENWMKAWILLVWARHNPEQMTEMLGDRLMTYFDGVAIPVPSMSGMAKRTLRPNKP